MNTAVYKILAHDMCKTIKQEAEITMQSYPLAKVEYNVLEVMGNIPRHLLMPEDSTESAYQNSAAGIGFGQSISQPYIVALMTSLLRPKPSDKVLEIGTGSGYQAAILSKLVAKVYTIEIIPELHNQAKINLMRLGLNNIYCECNDGKDGLLEFAPYDGIIVTAAASELPLELIRQLKTHARLIIPLVEHTGGQNLYIITKLSDTACKKECVLPVRFVTLT